MKKGLLIILAILVIVVLSMVGVYNSLVTQEEKVNTAWSQVENQYQRRADLIPNLVSTVQGYASHESQTLEAVIQARNNATRINIDAENLTPETLAQYNRAQGELGSALGRLLAISESYPDLKANQNFLELQSQLEGTENRIATERMRFNEAAREYNTSIRRFPRNMLASMFGFHTKPYFESQERGQCSSDRSFRLIQAGIRFRTDSENLGTVSTVPKF